MLTAAPGSLAEVIAEREPGVAFLLAEIVEAVIPSKLLTYMAAGRPVVVAAHPNSAATRQVRAADCGVWVAPAQPAALAEAILQLGADTGARQVLGGHGRAFVEKNFAREMLLQQYEACLLRALD